MKSHSFIARFCLIWTLLSIFALQARAEPLLNGLATHTELGKERFIAALYADTPSTSPATLIGAAEHKRMELRVTARRLSARRLQNLWIEGMAVNVPGSMLAEQAPNMVKFTSLIKGKLITGDRLTIDSIPGEGTNVAVNGVELGTIEDEQFFSLLMRTWIGSVPLSSDFRDQLLLAGEIDDALLGRFLNISPADSRVATVQSWLAPAETVEEPSEPAVAAVEAPVETPEPEVVEAVEEVAAAAPEPEVEAPATVALAAESAPVEELLDDEELIDEDELEEDAELLTAESLLSRQLYHSKLLKWTYKYISYPKRAAKRNQEGSVRLSVTIDRKGNVKTVAPIEESNFGSLNKEAIKAVKRASPFPPMPDALSGEDFEFSMPIVFRLPK